MCKTIAKAVTAVGLFLLVFLLSDLLGKNLYQWLEREHTELLYQYATDGQFSDNIYFSEETDKQFGVPGSLPGLVEEKSLSGIADYLTKEQWEMAEILEDNTAYLEYLQQQGTSLSGLFNFSERFAGLRDGLTYACRYLLFLLWLVALHFLMRCRPALYFAMGLLCIFATCIKLSGKLPSVLAGFSHSSPDCGRIGPAAARIYAHLPHFRYHHHRSGKGPPQPQTGAAVSGSARSPLPGRPPGAEHRQRQPLPERSLPATAPFQRLSSERKTDGEKGEAAEPSN